MTTHILTCGESTISSPDKALVLQFANLMLGADQVKAPAANTSVPAIGTYWEGQGGVNGGLFPGGDKPYYLIVPTGDDAESTLEWGGYGDELNGANSPWDGKANTADMFGADKPHHAAQFCSVFERDGHSDFYLMARREAAFLEITLGDKDVFSKNWHWSSTQRSAHYAFFMHFDDGNQFSYGKYGELRVRPVRRLPI